VLEKTQITPYKQKTKPRSISRAWEEWIVRPNRWWISMIILLLLVGGGSMFYIGHHTYTQSPPMANYVDENSNIIISHEQIVRGQVNFLKYGLMLYGSMFGDGALRGVDFSADALHKVFLYMQEYYTLEHEKSSDDIKNGIVVKVQNEIKKNSYDESKNSVTLSGAGIYAYNKLVDEYRDILREKVSIYQPQLKNATDEELKELVAFFYWGAWVCGAKRPGYDYSYTHNWPYDKEAGNTPSANVLLWSVLATLGLILTLGVVLYLHGRYSRLSGWKNLTNENMLSMSTFVPSVLQRATYKFFLAAALLFVLQVGAGVLSIHNYIGLENLFGIDVGSIVSLVSARSWHLQLGTLWISASWIGISIFLVSGVKETKDLTSQLLLVNLLFWVFLIMTAGILIGLLTPLDTLKSDWNFLGNQGWEFVEMGKLWQWMMLCVFVLWSIILFREIYPRFDAKRAWSLSNWLFYCVAIISLLFLSAFVAKPETNFVIADFWRWAVIHMWVEAFFEVFATIAVVYMMHRMNFISHMAASRIVYLSALLFLGTGLLGISHNFYWNAKPVATLAIGSIFSTLQVVPLILVALEAWKFTNLAKSSDKENYFSQRVAFVFLLGVNFWNFLGAGVFGFIINLPIVNYYEHGTYLTVNHGHAAFMGVYGNLSIGAMLFVSRYLLDLKSWDEKLLMRVFWSINIGLALMVTLDLFPAGVHQFIATIEHGFWFARSEEFIQTDTFQTLTWLRMIGGLVFVFGGVLPLAYFMLKSFNRIRQAKY